MDHLSLQKVLIYLQVTFMNYCIHIFCTLEAFSKTEIKNKNK